MPRLKEPIKISSRPPWLEGRQPFWRHQFAGGNAFLLSLLAAEPGALEANAEPRHFAALIEKSREQLRRAADLRLSGKRKRDTLTLWVEIENLTGHKFPTGHPYRRAWLHLRVSDQAGTTLFESGATDHEGHIRGLNDGYAPHHDIITKPDEVQIYQAVTADTQGQPTWSLLRAASYLKDNRLPPRGFEPDGRDADHIAVRGVSGDPNFHERANGRDEVTYVIPLSEAKQPVIAQAELLYQSVPPEAVARLLGSNEPAAMQFSRLYRLAQKHPETVASKRAKF